VSSESYFFFPASTSASSTMFLLDVSTTSPPFSSLIRIQLSNSAVATSSKSPTHNKTNISELPIPIHRPSPRRRILLSNRTIHPPLRSNIKNNRSRFKKCISLRHSSIWNGADEIGN
jgi:hypothetical protein